MLVVLVATSGRGLTLEEAIDTALLKNRELALSHLSQKEAVEKLHQAKSSFFPSLEVTGGYTRMSSVPIIEFTEGVGIPLGYYDNFSAAISLSFPLFTSGKRMYGYELARLGVEMSELETSIKECDVREEVSYSFYGLLVAQEAVKIAEEALGRAQDHLQTVRTQHRRGVVSQLDLLRAEYSYSEAETEYLRAENGQEMAIKVLNLLLGIDVDTPTSADGELQYMPVEEDVSYFNALAVERRPEINTLELGHQMASTSLSMAKFKNAPNLILALNYSYERPYQFEEKWGRTLVANLGVQFSLFDGFRNLSEIRQARIGVQKTQVQEELLRRAIQFEVETAYSSLMESEAELSVQKKALAQAEQALRTAEEQYKKGFIASLDYKDTAFAYTSAQFSHLHTLYQYMLSRVKLERAAGVWN